MTDYNTVVIWSAYDVPAAADINSNFANLDFLKTQVDKTVCQGRLTLETDVPVSTTDQTAAATLYFTPFTGSLIALFDGTASWDIYSFSELSLDISGLTADSNYDIFCYLSGGSPTLEALIWTDATNRATALTKNGGNWVKSGDATRRYLGTIRITGTAGQCEDSASKRFVWNAHNRVERSLLCKDTTNSWTYATASWRAANGSSTYGVARVGVVIGLDENLIFLTNRSYLTGSLGLNSYVGIGLDSVSANSAQIFGSFEYSTGNAQAQYAGYAGIGFHYFSALELANNSVTYYGDFSGAVQSGMRGHLMA